MHRDHDLWAVCQDQSQFLALFKSNLERGLLCPSLIRTTEIEEKQIQSLSCDVDAESLRLTISTGLPYNFAFLIAGSRSEELHGSAAPSLFFPNGLGFQSGVASAEWHASICLRFRKGSGVDRTGASEKLH